MKTPHVFRVRKSILPFIKDVVKGVCPPPKKLNRGKPNHPGVSPGGEEMVGVAVDMSSNDFRRLLRERNLLYSGRTDNY